MKTKVKILCRSQPRNRHEHVLLFLLGLAGLVDSLVVIATLGYISCDLRPAIIFSDWADEFINKD